MFFYQEVIFFKALLPSRGAHPYRSAVHRMVEAAGGGFIMGMLIAIGCFRGRSAVAKVRRGASGV